LLFRPTSKMQANEKIHTKKKVNPWTIRKMKVGSER
jgi:hypothetical protein